MNRLVLELSDDDLERLEEMSYYGDVDGEFQSPEMEMLGELIRTAIEELE